MEIEKFKTYESTHKGMDVNGIIDLMDTLQKMSAAIDMLKSMKPKSIEKKILHLLMNTKKTLENLYKMLKRLVLILINSKIYQNQDILNEKWVLNQDVVKKQ